MFIAKLRERLCCDACLNLSIAKKRLRSINHEALEMTRQITVEPGQLWGPEIKRGLLSICERYVGLGQSC